MFDCTVITARSTGATVRIAVSENTGRMNSNEGSVNVEGNSPSCPVSSAARHPARNAGTIAGNRVPSSRCPTT